MKRIASGILALLLVVVAICGVRMARLTAYAVAAPAADPALAGTSAGTDHLAGAIRFATVSTQDSAGFDPRPFLALHDYLRTAFPRVHATLTREVVNGYSLLYTWTGSDSSLDPVLLMAHLDVVPVEDGTESLWKHPPFGGEVADGFVWGRGAMDDKGSAIAILEAVESLLARGFQPRRTIYLAFGHDEEVGGANGAAHLARVLEQRTRHLAFLLDEGGVVSDGVIPGVSRQVALVGVVEKASFNVELTVQAAGGHSSIPPRHTAVGTLSHAIARLEDQQMPAHLTPVTERMMTLLAPYMAPARRFFLANLWLFRPVIVAGMVADERSAAVVRTTTAATMVSGSPKSNVLPIRARAVVNFRVLPGETGADVLAHVRRVVDDTSVRIAAAGSGTPSPVADYHSPEYALIEKTIVQLFPKAVPVPFLMVGGTDTRHYESLTRNVFRFNPFVATPDLIGGAHGTNERLRAEDFARGARFFAQLIENAQ